MMCELGYFTVEIPLYAVNNRPCKGVNKCDFKLAHICQDVHW